MFCLLDGRAFDTASELEEAALVCDDGATNLLDHLDIAFSSLSLLLPPAELHLAPFDFFHLIYPRVPRSFYTRFIPLYH